MAKPIARLAHLILVATEPRYIEKVKELERQIMLLELCEMARESEPYTREEIQAYKWLFLMFYNVNKQCLWSSPQQREELTRRYLVLEELSLETMRAELRVFLAGVE